MKIGLIGYGYVGKAVYEVLNKKHDVIIKEIDNTYDLVNDTCEVAVICVPTEQLLGGNVDISIVEEAVKALETKLIIIKSTIPPGTTEYLSSKYDKFIAFSPEYIGEGNYPIPHWEGYPHPTDMEKHMFTILGGPRWITKQAVDVFKPCFGPFHRYLQTDSTTAELVKYMENSYIATKVVFCNEFNEIAKAFGVDYNELRELWLQDKRVTRSHTLISEKRGFDGKCIPKDTMGIYKASQDKGYDPKFIKEVIDNNWRFKKNG